METNFSIARLGLLIKKQWADHSRLYGLSMIAILGLMAVALFLWSIIPSGGMNDRNYNVTTVMFFIGLFITGCIFSGMTFADLAQRTTGIYYLSVPATALEKLVCAVLYSQVFYNIFYVAGFFLLRALVLYSLSLHPDINVHYDHLNANDNEAFYYMGVGYASLQTLFLLGSIYFERFAFVKTIVSGVLVLLVTFLFMRYVVYPIMPHGHFNGDQSGVVFEKDGGGDGAAARVKMVFGFPKWLSDTLWFLLRYIWVPALWTVTYFRLKEKQL
jgi:hypothetical protein